MLMNMKNVNKIKYLKQLLSKGMFPSEKNRIWTMCQATLQMMLMTVAEAEKAKMTDEQFYLNFETAVSLLSTKDHSSDKDINDIKENLELFVKDSK